MKMKIFIVLSIAVAVVVVGATARADLVAEAEARKVAQGWVTMMIELDGDWGGAPSAEVIGVQELKRGDRVLAYYCEVKPSGHIVVSQVKGLAPVKAWSAMDSMDILSDEGPADLIKSQLERGLGMVERELGSLSDARPEAVARLAGNDHLPTWELLVLEADALKAEMASRGIKSEYGEGDELLSSNWHQGDPYYNWCPPGYNGCSDPYCPVGCVATAGAQIMRYWSWPPGRPWANMPDTVWPTSDAAKIQATAVLCWDVGVDVGMDWCSDGCKSSVPTEDMEDVYLAYLYSNSINIVSRWGLTQQDWFDYIKFEMNRHRPTQYRILKHSIVCDGYRITPYPQYHMNYGWGNGFNDWYAVDDLHQVDGDATILDEYMILDIRPINCLGSLIFGSVPRPIVPPYFWYVDMDCVSAGSAFASGQNLQFLHGMKLSCASNSISFSAGRYGPSKLVPYDTTMGLHLSNYGQMIIHAGGEVRIEGPPRHN